MRVDYDKDQLAYALANALKERDEAREKAERYRIEANAMMMQRDKARELLRLSSIEANALATSIQKSEYSDVNDFQLCESVAGVISQINNMYAGVREQRDEARDELKKLEGAYEDATNYYARMIELREELDQVKEELKNKTYDKLKS